MFDANLSTTVIHIHPEFIQKKITESEIAKLVFGWPYPDPAARLQKVASSFIAGTAHLVHEKNGKWFLRMVSVGNLKGPFGVTPKWKS